MLPRRLVRAVVYVVAFVVVSVALLGLANRHEYINVSKYIPYPTPSFFQPPSDAYVVDVAVGNCFRLNGNNPACAVPSAADGFGGDSRFASWHRVEKDVSLNGGFFSKQYLSYKLLKREAFAEKEQKSDLVITDIAVYNPASDDSIEGNTKIPLKILKEFRSKDVFDQEDQDVLEKLGVPGQLHSDEDSVRDAAEEAKLKGLVEEEQKQGEKAAENELQKAAEENKAADKAAAEDAGKQADSDESKDAVKADAKESDQEAQKEADSLKKAADAVNNPDPAAIRPEDLNQALKDTDKNEKRLVETDRDKLKMYYEIPTAEMLKDMGWVKKSNGIWVKYESYATKRGITALDVLFGDDCVDPRPNWSLVKGSPLRDVLAPKGRKPFITFRRGPKADYSSKKYRPKPKPNHGKFKILQVADLHFSTGVGKCRDPYPKTSGCLADPKTLRFVEQVLDIEKPDMVVLTGDQVFGDEAPDSETALYKALNPFIKRKIPFAITLGNHDDEGSIDRQEMMNICSDLPYSLSAVGPEEVDGFGNFVVNIEEKGKSAILLYFLDSHKYSPNPKASPGYDWIKQSQLMFVEREYGFIKEQKGFTSSKNHLSMAFFHIPLPEYRNMDQPSIGERREGITAPKKDTGVRKLLGQLGVKAVSVGHDHCNDYCLQDTLDKDKETENKMWLCYGGGVGEGGYAGYSNYVRRVRVFDLNTAEGEIRTWKRTHEEPDKTLDEQRIVFGGEVVNF